MWLIRFINLWDFSSDCEPGDGGCWGESINHLSPSSPLLATLCGWHIHSPPPWPGAAVSEPPEQHWTMHPIHCWGGDRREATIFGCVSSKRRQLIPHHLSVQKSHTHQPMPIFRLAPSCGTKAAVVRTLMHRAGLFIYHSWVIILLAYNPKTLTGPITFFSGYGSWHQYLWGHKETCSTSIKGLKWVLVPAAWAVGLQIWRDM